MDPKKDNPIKKTLVAFGNFFAPQSGMEGGNELAVQGRLQSIDVFRGITMFLLVADFTHLFGKMTNPVFDHTVIGFIGNQLHHHPWHGLLFWDLVQPFFMFIVGVALPFSVAKRLQRGDKYSLIVLHVIRRSFVLLLLGWMLYCIGPGRITFRFQNVLSQLSVTYLVAFLMMRKSWPVQIIFTFCLLLMTELLYRNFPLEGNEPFIAGKNFGSYVEILISREPLSGNWVSFNAIPTIAHTMWGVLAGKLLMSGKSANKKTLILIILGLIGLIAGYSLDPVSPIIKHICTSSFVIVSGGWCLLALAFCYWLIDIKKISKWSKFFIIVGMNPLFIYLIGSLGGADFLSRIPKPFITAMFGWAGELCVGIVMSLTTLMMLWYICYWLYKRKIFIKI